MIDRLFTAALAFTMLAGATFAVASAWFDSRSTQTVTQLPAVQVVARNKASCIEVARNSIASSSVSAEQ